MDLANQFQSLFTEAPGTTSLGQHDIKLTSDQLVRSRPYPVPYRHNEDGSHKGIQFTVHITWNRNMMSNY